MAALIESSTSGSSKHYETKVEFREFEADEFLSHFRELFKKSFTDWFDCTRFSCTRACEVPPCVSRKADWALDRDEFHPCNMAALIESSTSGSSKRFKTKVDDLGRWYDREKGLSSARKRRRGDNRAHGLWR
jgi:hypothetical protein